MKPLDRTSDERPAPTVDPPPRRSLPHLLLLGAFLLIIFGVPIGQALVDKLIEKEDKPVFLTLFDRAPAEAHLRAFEKTLEGSSTVEKKVRPFFQYWRYKLLGGLGEKALAGTGRWFFYTPGMRYLVEPYFRDLDVKPPTDPLTTIVDFRRQLAAHGIELLVVPLPGKATIYPDRLVAGLKPGPAFGAHTARFIAELRHRGVSVLDLTPHFLAARKAQPNTALYMAADTHWTGDGVKLAAALLATEVRKQAWYAARTARRAYTRKALTVERRGDVPKMTKIPHQERLFVPERVAAYQVFDAAGKPYEDPEENKDAPILLLGDSFSRVFQTDAPEAAGLIANLAFELQLPLSSIINDGGASTLVRQALARDLTLLAGKKLVIYAFVERDIRLGLKGWQKIELWTKDELGK